MTPIEQWAAEMRFEGKAPTTIRCRSRALRLVAKEVGDPLTLGRLDLMAWLDKREHPSTRSTLLAYLRSFYQWAHREGLIDADPTVRIRAIKVPKGTPRPAPVDDFAAMLAKAPPRTVLFARLMAECGLRSCEVAGVRAEHIGTAPDGRRILEIPRAKGGGRQSVPIPADLADDIAAAEPWAVSAQTVQKCVRQAFIAAGSPVKPHQLRHLFGTNALHTAGGDLRKAQELLRHASPATTARYTDVTPEELSDVVDQMPRYRPPDVA